MPQKILCRSYRELGIVNAVSKVVSVVGVSQLSVGNAAAETAAEDAEQVSFHVAVKVEAGLQNELANVDILVGSYVHAS